MSSTFLQLRAFCDHFSRYVRNRGARRLQECTEQLAAKEAEIKNLQRGLDQQREQINAIGREIAEEGAYIIQLRENERFRKLKKNLRENQQKIGTYDMEVAAKARRQFDEKYGPAKKKESDMQAEVSILAKLR